MTVPKRPLWLVLIALLPIGSALVYRFHFHKPLRQISYSQFVAESRSGHVAEVHIGEKDLVGLVRPDKSSPPVPDVVARRLPGVELSEFLKELETRRIPVAAATDKGGGWHTPL